MKRHQWKPDGGCRENPGVFDNGNGGMLYVDRCAQCDLIRKLGRDYTGHRDQNNFGPYYYRSGERVKLPQPCHV
jgi:hypothetical protein